MVVYLLDFNVYVIYKRNIKHSHLRNKTLISGTKIVKIALYYIIFLFIPTLFLLLLITEKSFQKKAINSNFSLYCNK